VLLRRLRKGYLGLLERGGIDSRIDETFLMIFYENTIELLNY
jgi:hypothetical protein